MELVKQTHADLMRHEGLRLKVYQDTVGVWTIGYGHTGDNITKDTQPITKFEAEAFLLSDMYNAHMEVKKALKRFWDTLDPVRQGVLINMAFNLGWPRLSQFKATLAHIEKGEYSDAAEHMLASLWAKQVGNRAKELAKRMETGRIDPSHLVT